MKFSLATPAHKRRLKFLAGLLVLLLFAAGVSAFLQRIDSLAASADAYRQSKQLALKWPVSIAKPGQVIEQKINAQVATWASTRAKGYEIVDPTSVAAVVNRQRPVTPQNFVPATLVDIEIPNSKAQQLVPEAAKALERFYADTVAATGVGFRVCSSFRSFETQQQLYQESLAANGQAATEAFIARPGYSEHQLGLAVDLGHAELECGSGVDLNTTPVGKWMQANAAQYGFLLRYTVETEAVTGSAPEWWHWRYVGSDITQKMQQQNIKTLEEFFELGAAVNY